MSEEGRSGHKEEVFTIGRFVGGVAHTRLAPSSPGASPSPLHSRIKADLTPNGGTGAPDGTACVTNTVQYKMIQYKIDNGGRGYAVREMVADA